MTKTVCVPCTHPIAGRLKPHPDHLPEIDLNPGGRSIPAPDSNSAANSKSIFDPQLELGQP